MGPDAIHSTFLIQHWLYLQIAQLRTIPHPMYQKAFTFLSRIFSVATIFKFGFNWSPMYRRSTGRVKTVSPDCKRVEVQIPHSWKNVNYVGSIFGGSMLSATDPIMMIQLIQILGDDYVVWDKSVTMRFKRPARERLYVVFEFSDAELDEIRSAADANGEVDWEKELELKTKDGLVCAVASKTLYIATKAHYKAKRAKKKEATA